MVHCEADNREILASVPALGASKYILLRSSRRRTTALLIEARVGSEKSKKRDSAAKAEQRFGWKQPSKPPVFGLRPKTATGPG
jgi:hypothetical protein